MMLFGLETTIICFLVVRLPNTKYEIFEKCVHFGKIHLMSLVTKHFKWQDLFLVIQRVFAEETK